MFFWLCNLVVEASNLNSCISIIHNFMFLVLNFRCYKFSLFLKHEIQQFFFAYFKTWGSIPITLKTIPSFYAGKSAHLYLWQLKEIGVSRCNFSAKNNIFSINRSLIEEIIKIATDSTVTWCCFIVSTMLLMIYSKNVFALGTNYTAFIYLAWGIYKFKHTCCTGTLGINWEKKNFFWNWSYTSTGLFQDLGGRWSRTCPWTSWGTWEGFEKMANPRRLIPPN